MKKIALIMIITILLSIVGCSNKQPSYIKDITIEGSIFSGESEKQVSVQLKYDDSWITTNKNTKYNPDLASLCVLLCADSYFMCSCSNFMCSCSNFMCCVCKIYILILILYFFNLLSYFYFVGAIFFHLRARNDSIALFHVERNSI